VSGLTAVILAAGKSVRFKSARSKLLHPLLGRPVFEYTLAKVRALKPERIVAVLGDHTDALAGLYPDIAFVRGVKPLGTAFSFLSAKKYLSDGDGLVFLIAGDVPLVREETLKGFARDFARRTEYSIGVITTDMVDPTGYGRILRDGERIAAIVEEKDATRAQKIICEINSGIYLFRRKGLLKALSRIGKDNAKGEFYLTDVVKFLPALAYPIADPYEVLGINTRRELSIAGEILLEEKIGRLMEAGVSFVQPHTVYLDYDVEIGQDTTVYPHTIIRGGTSIGRDGRIGPFTMIDKSAIGHDCHVLFSHLNRVLIGDSVSIGPFANLRPGSVVGDGAKIGDFVELKKSVVAPGAKIPHLSYVGDAEVGSGVNIGAGTITCNYDGVAKHKTIIEEDVFVGSNTTIIAPRRLGKGSYIAAGSTINEDVPPGALAVGRARQVNKAGYSKVIKTRILKKGERK